MRIRDASVRFRPFRLGVCIQEGNEDALTEAVRQLTALWAGFYFPIISVGQHAEDARALVKWFQLDALIALTIDSETQDFVESFPFLVKPDLVDSIFVDLRPYAICNFVDICSPILALSRSMNSTGNISPQVYLPAWDPVDPLGRVIQMTFGDFPSPEISGVNYGQLARQALGAQTVVIQNEPIPENLYAALCPSELNRYGVSLETADLAPSIFIGDGRNSKDLIAFWNLRASGKHILFIDSSEYDRTRRFAMRVAQGTNYSVDCYVSADGNAMQVHDRFIHPQICLRGMHQIVRNGQPVWTDYLPMPYFAAHQVLMTYFKDDDNENPQQISATCHLPGRPFLENSRAIFQRYITSVRQYSPTDVRRTYLLEPPFIPELNLLFGNRFHFAENRIRAERHGVGIVTNLFDTSIMLRSIDPGELLRILFEYKGLTLRRASTAGLVATRLLNGFDGFYFSRLLKVHGVRELFFNDNKLATFTRPFAIDTIMSSADEGAEPFYKFGLFIGDSRRLSSRELAGEIFDELLDRFLFRAGLELRCPGCLLKFWNPLDDVRLRSTCSFCDCNFSIASQLNVTDWKFRRSSALGKMPELSDEVTSLLLALQLDSILRESNLVSSLGIEVEIAGTFEPINLIGISKEARTSTWQLVIGKSVTGAELTDGNVRTLAYLLSLGDSCLKVRIAVAKLGAFTDDEVTRLKELRLTSDYDLLILGEDELSAYEPMPNLLAKASCDLSWKCLSEFTFLKYVLLRDHLDVRIT
jgi:hypothetical protein